MIPAGTCPSVGIAGLTLGGGHGYASRKLGLTCDALLGLTIVTASGEVLHCDAHRHADLFWACRGGGGGNFGVVTSFAFRTTPVAEVATYVLEWPWSQVRQVVAAWQAFAPHAPDALSLDLNLTATDVRPHVTSAGQYLGSAAELRRALAPLLAAGTPSRVQVVERTFLEASLHFAGCDREGVEQCRKVKRETWKAKSDYVKRPLPRAAVDVMARAAANLTWMRGFYASLRPWMSGEAYVNYIDPELRGWQRAYYGSNYTRLRRVKHRYDPTGFFRFAQGIH